MEIRVTESSIIPFRRPTEKEIEVVSWVNQPNILVRNAKANAYIEEVRAKKMAVKKDICETIGYFVSGALMFLLPFILYILGENIP